MSYKRSTTLIARDGYGPTSGVLDKIGDFLKSAGKGALSVYGSAQQSAGQAAAYQQIATQATARPAMPSWVMPVALVGGVAVIAMLVMKPRKNPARGRRRRRRHYRRHR